MPIFLDDHPIELAGDDLAEVLLAAQDQLRADGRVVVEVQVDGEALSGDRLEARRDQAVAASEVRLYSAEPSELAIDALDQVRDRLAQTRALQSDAADLLQQDRAIDAMQKIAEIAQAWMQAQQAVFMAAGLAGIDIETLTVDGEPITNFTDPLIAGLRDLKQTIAAQDTVALADALAYEWPALTDRWDGLIAALMEKIETRDAPGNES